MVGGVWACLRTVNNCSLWTPPWWSPIPGALSFCPPNPSNQLFGRRGHGEGQLLRMLKVATLLGPQPRQSLRRTDGRTLGSWPGHGAQQGTVVPVGNLAGAADLSPAGDRPRVKFLVMSDGGPVAETEWSEEIDLQRAQSLQAAARSHSPNSEVIITALSVLLAVLAAALLTLLVYTCFTTCRNTPISGPGDPMQVRRYNTHHMFSPPASGSS
ncbi:uroplakin-3b-like protein 1 isoform X3 [Erinaceus europaeus]|uniref:Uroplakin-3b-like protein 1 isoform X3 n=1 Tax=Erinaceus europaeus TaxID=9365 RepID=A0ABM3VYN8_ERIEU|nr:uroplakin-3b-like protein 1 isoform X3 [Erinaceus europaeus]